MILKRNMLVMALASTGLCMAFGVQAQTAPSTQAGTTQQSGSTSSTSSNPSNDATQTGNQNSQKQLTKSLSAITVTGYSATVEKSLDYQRYADTIQNVITSADIGGLPDQSIADSLTRLPGVSAERIAGQASQINIRGLSGNFIETTLDGREQPSTSGSNYIQFDQYPSELINMATVYKSSQASLIEGGVAGTIAHGDRQSSGQRQRHVAQCRHARQLRRHGARCAGRQCDGLSPERRLPGQVPR